MFASDGVEHVLGYSVGVSPTVLRVWQRQRRWLRSTSMRSATLGRNTSQDEVTNVSPHGSWLFVGEDELFVSFKDFPWFRDLAADWAGALDC